MIKTLIIILLLELAIIPVAVLGHREEMHTLVAFKAFNHLHLPHLVIPIIKSNIINVPITITVRRIHYSQIKPHPSEEKPWLCEIKQLEQGYGEVIVCQPQ